MHHIFFPPRLQFVREEDAAYAFVRDGFEVSVLRATSLSMLPRSSGVTFRCVRTRRCDDNVMIRQDLWLTERKASVIVASTFCFSQYIASILDRWSEHPRHPPISRSSFSVRQQKNAGTVDALSPFFPLFTMSFKNRDLHREGDIDFRSIFLIGFVFCA